MKIVLLDTKSIGTDIDFSILDSLGEIVKYDFSTQEEALERTKDADVVITNRVRMDDTALQKAEKLKLICLTATGTDMLDFDYLKERKISWRNVCGYSTENVMQHTFSMLFYLLEHMRYYDDYVRNGNYVNASMFSHFANTIYELNGKTWGIIGLGTIGKRVAEVATAFGCNIIYYSASGKNNSQVYTQVDLDTLLRMSDIVSIHTSLNEMTRGMIGKNELCKMKSSGILLNLGRGAIVNEDDLADILMEEGIAGAGLDVLSQEPMREDNPLRCLNKSDRLVITPHIGWASIESRTRLIKIIKSQIQEYFQIGNKK